MMNKSVILFVGLSMVAHAYCGDQTQVLSPMGGAEFVIADRPVHVKKRSSSQLKEEIGQQTKQTCEDTTRLLRQMGTLQKTWAIQQKGMLGMSTGLAPLLQESISINDVLGVLCNELAALQTTYMAVVEKLIDNKKPFKKAPKVDLEKTLGILTSMHRQLVTTTHSMVQLEHAIRTTKVDEQQRFSNVAINLRREQGKVHSLVMLCKQDTCLKDI